MINVMFVLFAKRAFSNVEGAQWAEGQKFHKFEVCIHKVNL